MQIEELFKKHVSDLYLLCPTIPPRVLSNDQWWEVIKELCGLSHIIPFLNSDFKKMSLTQIEYLIIQFIQSNPPVLALKWLMNLYSLINKYIKLSVGRLSSEIMLLLHKFTGIEVYEVDIKKTNNLNFEIYFSSKSDFNSNNILDISDSPPRDIQPSHVITSLYIIQTLLRLEILETRKDVPVLLKYLPQLITHVDNSMRDAANECLLTTLILGIPSYSIANNLIDSLFQNIKVLIELDDSLNIERVIQSLIVIFNQFPKFANTRKQDILQLIVNISSSLVSENPDIVKNTSLIESISNLLSNSTIIDTFHYKNKDPIEAISYLTNIANIKFSTYGLGSYPVNGEYFRVIVANSIICFLRTYFDQCLINSFQLEKIWQIILNNLQTYFIRKHITENLQWLTNNHWVFLWTRILKYILYNYVFILQKSIKQTYDQEKQGIIIWTKFEHFITPLSKISPRISLECVVYLVERDKDSNWFWKFNKEVQNSFIKWLFNISLTENFEMIFSSYLSGKLCGYLVNEFTQDSSSDKINFIFQNLIKSDKNYSLLNCKDQDFLDKLTHTNYFLIGLSNSISNIKLMAVISQHISEFLFSCLDIKSLGNPKLHNQQLFLLNNIFLLINNILSNIIYFKNSINSDISNQLILFISQLFQLDPVWKNILSIQSIEKIVTIIESITESIEKFQILKENNELRFCIYDDEKENPILLLFKDLKQWIALIWTTIESIQLFIQIKGVKNQQNSNQINKLDKFLTKSCFYIVNKLLPSIPITWTYLLPEKKDAFINIESEMNLITEELNSKFFSVSTSMNDLSNLLINKDINKDFINYNFCEIDNLNQIHVQKIEKFNFPYIGDENCFSKSVHISVLIILLKLSVYKQLNKNLFQYFNHPPISNNALSMVFSDLVSDPILMLNLKFPNEIFPLKSSIIEKSDNKTISLMNDCDIFNLYEDLYLINHFTNTLIISEFGLLESMKTFMSFPLIYNRLLINSEQHLEIIFRQEVSKLISNLIFENLTTSYDKMQPMKLIKIIFKLLFKRTIYNFDYWNLIVSESKYIEQDNTNIQIQSFYENYSDLSPTLYLMSLKNTIASSNDVRILPILSILWCLKMFIESIIEKINSMICTSLVDQNCFRLINTLHECLYYIFSFLLKYLFGFKSRDLKIQIVQSTTSKDKKSKLRVRSSIVRLYSINLLIYLISYFHEKRSNLSYYYSIKKKLENIIAWSNYSHTQASKTTEDNDTLSDIYLFFGLIKSRICGLDQEMVHIINIFFKDHSNSCLSLKNKLFICKINENIKLHNSFIENIINDHFKFESFQSNHSYTKNFSLIDIYGEYLSFYNLKELMNMNTLNYIIDFVHYNIKLFLNDKNNPQQIEDFKFEYEQINSTICISLSLILETRIHEIPSVNYENRIYISNTCKILFFKKDFFLDFWRFILKIYKDANFITQNNDILDLDLPILNFLGLLIMNSIFINGDLSFFENFSVQDFEILHKQDNKYLLLLFDWILRNKNKVSSLSFLEKYLDSLNLTEINIFVLKIIDHQKNNSSNISYSNNINDISNFLLDGNNCFDLSFYPLYIQLKFFMEFSVENEKFNFPSNIVHNVNFTIITKILKIVSLTFQSKISRLYDYNYKLIYKLTAYKFTNYVEEKIKKENNFIVFSNQFINFILNTISILIDIYGKDFGEKNTKDSFLENYLSILNEVSSVLFKCSQICIFSDFSGFINKIFELLLYIGSKNIAPSLFTIISEFFINIYFSLSKKNRKSLWELIINISFENIEMKFFNEKNLLYQLILKTSSQDIVEEGDAVLGNNKTKLISIYLKLMQYLISNDHSINYLRFVELLGIFIQIGYFIINNVNFEDLSNKSKELFDLKNINFIIKNIFKKYDKLFQGQNDEIEGIYYIPSLVSIWNSINKCFEFTDIIIEFFLICYNKMNCSLMNVFLFIIETTSCFKYLIDANSIYNDLDVNEESFKSLILLYLNQSKSPSTFIMELNSNSVPKTVIYSKEVLMVKLLYYFSLEISFQKCHLVNKTNLETNINKLIIYQKFYDLISDFIKRNNLSNHKQVIFIKSTNHKLLEMYKYSIKLNVEFNLELSPILNELGIYYYNLIIQNLKTILSNKQYQILVYTHLYWIENQIKKSFLLSNKSLNLKFYDQILKILTEILLLIKHVKEKFSENSNSEDFNIENLKDLIFRMFKYYLFSPIYIHPSYFDLLDEFLVNNQLESEKTPDFNEFIKLHEYFQNLALNAIKELSETTDEYNSEIFDLIKMLLIPFGFSYNVEYSTNEYNLMIPMSKAWKVLKNLIHSEKKQLGNNEKSLRLYDEIKFFISKYSEFLNSETIVSIPFILPSSLIVIWFQKLFTRYGNETINEFNNYMFKDNRIKVDYSNWLFSESYYLPKDDQIICIEFNKDETKSKELKDEINIHMKLISKILE